MLRLVYGNDGEAKEILLNQDKITVGRLDDNILCINDHTVSRFHAVIEKMGETFYVCDLQSRNGVRINNKVINRAPIKLGDVIQFGAVEVKVEEEFSEKVVLSDLKELEEQGTIIRNLSEIEGGLKQKIPLSKIPLKDELGRRLRIYESLSEIGRTLISVSEFSSVMEKIMDIIFTSLQTERAVIMLYEESTGELVPTIFRDKKNTGESISISRTIARKAFEERVAILTSDAQVDPRFKAGDSIHSLGIRSALCVPLWAQDQTLGIIYVDSPLMVKAFDEFDLELLTGLANYSAIAIDQARLREKILREQRARARLERYHSPAVADQIMKSSELSSGMTMNVKEVEASIIFADIVGFTSITEKMPPREVALMLNDYFSRMTEVIFEHEGTLDKYIGDAFMAIFGAPIPQKDHAILAIKTALKMKKVLEAMNAERDKKHILSIRMGINSGRVVAGDIGSIKRMEYTVLGSTVNLASRLEAHIASAGKIIIGESTYHLVKNKVLCNPLPPTRVKGFEGYINAYEVLGEMK